MSFDEDDDGLPDWDDVPDHIIAFENSEAGRSAREWVEAYHAECARLQSEEYKREQDEEWRSIQENMIRRYCEAESRGDDMDSYGSW